MIAVEQICCKYGDIELCAGFVIKALIVLEILSIEDVCALG